MSYNNFPRQFTLLITSLKRLLLGVSGLSGIALLGWLDYLSGHELGFSLFYLAPISFVTWHAGRYYGLAMAVISATVWLIADLHSGHVYSHPAILIWNTFIRAGFFVIVTLLLSALRRALQAEQALARTDYLTGAANKRFFFELAEKERLRSQRSKHPLSLAYIDLDNFKWVNDNLGHGAGDNVLKSVAHCLQQNLRQTDTVTRLGGDEFALLLPETDATAAQQIASKLQKQLLEQMSKQQWPVTFSIGVVSFRELPPSIELMIKSTDELMYAVKLSGKNNIRVEISPPTPA